jgi:hypothetical protein
MRDDSGMGSGLDTSNADLHQSFLNNVVNTKVQTYNMTAQEINEMRVDVALLDQLYDKWAEEDDSMSDVLNVKITKSKNADFRLKIDAWRARAKERKANHKRNFEHGKALRDVMERQLQNFNLDRDKMHECISAYNVLAEDMKARYKENKIINNFLAELQDASNHMLFLDDLEKVFKVI